MLWPKPLLHSTNGGVEVLCVCVCVCVCVCACVDGTVVMTSPIRMKYKPRYVGLIVSVAEDAFIKSRANALAWKD